jgi:hypothetical protein
MSAHQAVCHVADGLRMAVGEKPVRQDGGPLQRTLVKWIALYVPIPWPSGIATSTEIDQALEGTPPVDFASDLAQVEALLERVTTATRTLDRQLHPRFGRMSDAAWLRWGYLHLDHHLRQFGVD